MLPCSTYVLDHTLALTPDHLFDVVADFVSPLLSDPPRPLWARSAMRFTLTGVEWDAGRTAINVNAQLYLPRQEDHWHLRDTGTYQIVHAPTIQWDSGSSTGLVQVEVTPCGTGQVRARIMAHPGTEAEQLAIRLAAHVVRESACTAYCDHAQLVQAQDAASREWRAWLEARITGLMAEKKAREEEFVFPVERQVTLRSLSTTVDILMEELWKHFWRFPPENVPTEEGTISLKAIPASGYPRSVESPSLYMFARQHLVRDGVEVPPAKIIGPVMFFKGFRRGTERIDVVVTCLHR